MWGALALHDKMRAAHGAPPLEWSAECAVRSSFKKSEWAHGHSNRSMLMLYPGCTLQELAAQQAGICSRNGRMEHGSLSGASAANPAAAILNTCHLVHDSKRLCTLH